MRFRSGIRRSVRTPRLEFLESRLALAGDIGTAESTPLPGVTISEIMYHTADGRSQGEYVELQNRGVDVVQLEGWQFTRGLRFQFPKYSLDSGQRVVVAADIEYFTAEYPDVDNVVGDWVGRLSNRGETIELVDAEGQFVDSVRYADQGEWADRILDAPDHGHEGWAWDAPHDGDGASLELVNLNLPNDHGQNWAASQQSGGTPGAVNSVAMDDTAPLILAVAHAPTIPTSSDKIVVTAGIQDEAAAGASAMLHYRIDGTEVTRKTRMYDDGLGADRQAGDGTFTATIPAQSDQTIVRFFVTATDSGGLTRNWPRTKILEGQRRPDALLQVLDDFAGQADWTPDQPPVTYVIMTAAERDELADIGDGPLDEALSNAQMNGTFIRVDGRGTHVRYLVGVRNRGGASRIGPPNNYRINFPNDRPWDEATRINLNSLFVAPDIIGNAVYRLAGMPAAFASPVQMWVNGVNVADPSLPGMSSVYAQMEVINGRFPDRHFPNDADGNLYRVDAAGTESGDLRYEGPVADAYRDTYSKRTNETDDDWSDLIQLTDVLNNTSDDEFLERVSEVIDLQQWMRFLALDALLGNRETGLSMGVGDNFWLYRGTIDRRFKLIPHDLDTIMGVGRTAQPNRSLFTYTAVPGLQRLLTHPQTVPLYYQAFKDLMTDVFNPETMNPLLDRLLKGVSTEEEIDEFKQFVVDRMAGVTAQIPQEFVVSSPLPQVDGFYRTTLPVTELVGTADAVRTKSVMVNGQPAEWSPFSREWSLRPSGDAEVTVVIDQGAEWNYLDNGLELSRRWRSAGFDDSEWSRGQAPFGYGIGDEATTVDFGSNPNDRFISTYFRRTFDIGNVDLIRNLTLRLQRDDGAIVYLNGIEIARSNMPEGETDFQTVASTWVGAQDHLQFHSFNVDPSWLQNGENVLAVEVHQRSPIDRDLWFDLQLEAAVGILEGGVELRPGINRVAVQAFDAAAGLGAEIDRSFIDIWYDGAAGIDVPVCDQLRGSTNVAAAELTGGVLDQDTTLAPCGPAYRVTGQVVVPDGVTLTILPGTTLFFDAQAEILFDGGRLIAQGAPNRLIRFTRTVGSNASWGGLQFRDSNQDNRIAYAVMEYGATDKGMIGLERSRLDIDRVTFDHSDRFRIRTVNSSLSVRNSTFEDIFVADEPPTTDNQSEQIWGSGILEGGYLVIENNIFGSTKGHNDLIDFDGAQRPGPIPIIRNNIFAGSGDDVLDLEADAYIEGNVFRRVIKDSFNTASGEANAISAGGGRDYVVVRNVFQDVDHAVQVKDDAFLTFQNNTVNDAHISAIYFDLEDRSPGRGALVEDSIIESTPIAFGSIEETTDLVVNRSIVPPDAAAFGVDNVSQAARFLDPAAGDLRLGAGSPARGTGQNGWDRGALVPPGASVSGEPPSMTTQVNATLNVGGPGMTHYRYRLDDNPWGVEQAVEIPLSLTDLPDGPHQVQVVGKDSAGQWQAFDQATQSRTWTVSRQLESLRINEVLAANDSAVNIGGQYPDLIELFNAGSSVVDLSGMSLTDDPLQPRRYVIPPGTAMQPDSFLVLSSGAPTNDVPLGMSFGLSRTGEAVYLYDAPERSGTLLDSVEFGLQLGGFSLGRVEPDLQWRLNRPTLGTPNVAQTTGDPKSLRINEWFTRGDVRFEDDYIELFNPDPLPVALGGMSLSDDPVSRPDRHTIAPLSFIDGDGFTLFRGDRNVEQGANHLPFRLAADQGQLALRDTDGRVVDQVIYSWQSIDFSEGRYPDGDPDIMFQSIPTPGLGNQVKQEERQTLIDVEDSWRFNASGIQPLAEWSQPGFDDSAWQIGPGVLAAEDGDLPAKIGTPLPLGSLAYYFRRSFRLPDAASGITLELTPLIDDGAVFYMNGNEFLRLGIPEGPVDAESRANRGVGNAQFEGPFNVPSDLLRSGDNVLAVEVHQITRSNSDVVFGLMLEQVGDRSNVVVDQALALLEGLRITEIMYDPEGDERLEFIELKNISDVPLDLANVRIEGGVEFTFGRKSLDPGMLTVVARDLQAFRSQYGAEVDLAGQYRGRLANRSEDLQLLLPSPLDVGILRFEYFDDWYSRTAGQGFSLTAMEPLAPASMWSLRDQWRPSQQAGGTPGSDEPSPGDFDRDGQAALPDLQLLCAAVLTREAEGQFDLNADDRVDLNDVAWWLKWVAGTVVGDTNLDGVFNSADLVQILQAGLFGVDSGGPVLWQQGDWNCDGRFTSTDLVLAIQEGHYETGG